MIIAEHNMGSGDIPDTASVNTLVEDTPEPPRHYMKLIWASILLLMLCLIFVSIPNIFNESGKAALTILGFIFVIPQYTIAILMEWSQYCQYQIITAMRPGSPLTLVYAAIIVILWIASTAVCGKRLYDTTHFHGVVWRYGDIDQLISHVDINDYWPSIMALITSLLELIVALCVVFVCYRAMQSKEAPSSSSSLSAEVKHGSA